MPPADQTAVQTWINGRFTDFEKLMDARFETMLKGQEATQKSLDTVAGLLSTFMDKVANLPTDYVPRREVEKEQERLQKEIDAAKKEAADNFRNFYDNEYKPLRDSVASMMKWRYYVTGGAVFIGIVIGWVAEAHPWTH